MITLEGKSLVFRFPEVHEHANAEVHFQRTLRIPDNGKEYPLPPGFGSLSLKHVEDYTDRVPASWRERGGVMMPLYQAEATWLDFHGCEFENTYPFALKIAAGKINAVSGKPWKPELEASERDYVVLPEQPWLDGFCVAKDVVRQFVAMPLGSGYSVEEQITGKAEHGGLQIIAYPMKRERYDELVRRRDKEQEPLGTMRAFMGHECDYAAEEPAMGLAPGGRMRQEIYADPHGIDAWHQTASHRCFVTLVNAAQWAEITGELPEARPPTAADYSNAGLPWFDYYAADLETLAGSPALTKVKSVAELAAEKGEQVLGPDEDFDLDILKVLQLIPWSPQSKPRPVRSGRF